jgi:hypothetical protein
MPKNPMTPVPKEKIVLGSGTDANLNQNETVVT